MSAYQSTLPRRTRPAEARDFFCENFRIDGVPVEQKVGHVDLHWWNAHIPLMPADFASLFSENFGGGIKINIELDGSGFTLYLKSSEGKFEGSAEFLSGRTKEIRNAHSTFQIAPESQGQGIGKLWLKSLVELSVAMGDSAYRFYAGMDNGAYSWASMGIPMDMAPEIAEKRAFQSERMMARIDALKDFLPVYDYGIARSFCRLSSEDDIVNFVRYEVPLPNEIGTILEEPGSSIFESLKKSFDEKCAAKPTRTSAYDERGSMKDAFKASVVQKKDFTLARCTLSCTLWPAIIDFNNERRMEKIGSTLGGWNTIRPL